MSSMSELREHAQEHDDQLLPASIGQKLVLLPFSQIRPFTGHPFRLYAGERLTDMVESIRQNGILMPLIVQRIHGDPNYDYGLLSGHNRMNAGGIAGLTEALCLVKSDLSEDQARMYVIETNLIQRSFKDLLPSEKAAVLAMRYSEMFSQGKRNDIIRELRVLGGKDETCGTEFHKPKNRDTVGREYELTGRMVAKYVRLDHLTDPLKLRLDNKEFVINAGVSLSYLNAEEQTIVESVLTQTGAKLTDAKASKLRASAGQGASAIAAILADAQKKKPDRIRKANINQDIYDRYFAPDTSDQELEETIAQALELYFTTKRGASA